jgi:hypothetical protein
MSQHQTFLPEDYIAQKAERRTNIICIALFLVVMAGVFGAFVVTNRQWTRVKERQNEINHRYQNAAMQIEDLNELERQRDDMLEKAELAASLVERVPRSILPAELINRRPPRLGLLKFEMTSEKVRTQVKPVQAGGTGNLKGKKGKPQRGRTKAEAQELVTKVEVPKHTVMIVMTGVAPTDLEVSRYLSELNAYDLLRDVTLDYSEEQEIEGRIVREFSIKMNLDMAADIRDVEPLVMPRNNPMDDTVQFGLPQSASADSAEGR